MTEVRTYPAGVPSWIDTDQPDASGARHFYAELFGWTYEQVADAYWIASLDGREVAGLGAANGSGAEWNSYIEAGDVDDTVARSVANGGRVVAAPTDVGSAGRMAAVADPTGAQVRLWQARDRLGAQVVNVPDSWNFSNLLTHDTESAKAFYAAVFGWEADILDAGGDAAATMWRRPGYGDHLEATIDPGIRERQSEVGAPPGFEDSIAWLVPLAPGEPSHWQVTFTAADRDHQAAAAERLGAVVVSSEETQWTRTAEVRDPQGARFTLSQFTPG